MTSGQSSVRPWLPGPTRSIPALASCPRTPTFAEAVEAAGIRWVGPPPSAIRAMGDKASARRLATGLGIPVVPGYDGDDQSDPALLEAARRIAGGKTRRNRRGHPVLIKPAAGGGGKGMRVVTELDPATTFTAALATARREALAAFGDTRLILEQFLAGPRHVEIQVLFDAHGNGVHLGERDCSVQRRHQKVLEESPSPAVDQPLRDALGRAALTLAAAVGYRSAGTCEFLLDDDGTWHFLEMNTRLQVEHPVTELITGRDLVADQLRIAAGEALGVGQAEIDAGLRSGGHAIEVRLYAEDPDAGFLPSAGRVEALRWPAERPPGRHRDRGRLGHRHALRPDAGQADRRGPGPGRGTDQPEDGPRPDCPARPADEPALPALAGGPAGRPGGRSPNRHARGNLAAVERSGRRSGAVAGGLAGGGPCAGELGWVGAGG